MDPGAGEPEIRIQLAFRLDDLEDRLRVVVDVGNRDTLSRNVLIPTCNPTVEVYDPADGRLVWSERRWREDTLSCQPQGPTTTLTPGVTIGARHEVRDDDVLGDSLAAGSYRAVVLFTLQQPEAAYMLEVGSVRLGLP